MSGSILKRCLLERQYCHIAEEETEAQRGKIVQFIHGRFGIQTQIIWYQIWSLKIRYSFKYLNGHSGVNYCAVNIPPDPHHWTLKKLETTLIWASLTVALSIDFLWWTHLKIKTIHNLIPLSTNWKLQHASNQKNRAKVIGCHPSD